MRGLRSTLALLIALGGLAAYIYFVTWKQPENGSESKQEKVFAALEADKIEEIRLTSESGDTTSLKKDKEEWRIVEPLAVPAQASEITTLASNLAQLEIDRVIEDNPTNLNDYGLSTPRIEVSFKAAGDKESRRLLVGQKTPTGTNLYAKRNDEKRVFLIQAFQEQAFNKSTFDLRDKTVVKFERDKVDRVAVDADGKTLELSKTGAEWKLSKPLQAAADFGAVEGLVGRVQSAQMKSIVAESASPADLKKYGLDKPSVTVSLNLGSAKAQLLIGGKAEGGTVYARDASKPLVMTLEGTLVDELKKAADEYRRKDLFEFRAYNANRLEIGRGGQTVVFEKVKAPNDTSEDTWRRVSPNPADVDKEKMSVMLAKLESMRAASFVDSTAKTGLDAPALTVLAKFDEGKKEERVAFGKSGDNVHAARGGEPGAATVSAMEFDEFVKKLDELAK